MKSFKSFLEEGSLDAKDIVHSTFQQHGIKPRYEGGGKHNHAIYNMGGKEHKFSFRRGKMWDGPIRHQIARDVKKHIEAAKSGQGGRQ